MVLTLNDQTKDRVHPVCAIFPMMTEPELAALTEDIRANGQQEPIMLLPDGTLLDGRNRLAACRRLGIKCQAEVWGRPEGEAAAWILSVNLRRRQMTAAQRGALGAELANLEDGTNQFRLRIREGVSKDTPSQTAAASGPVAVKIAAAAAAVGVSVGSVKRGNMVLARDPAVFDQVKAGKLSMNKALERIGLASSASDATNKRRGAAEKAAFAKAEAKAAAAHEAAKLRLVHDADGQLIEQLCQILHRLREVSEKADPVALLRKFPPELLKDLDISLLQAAEFVARLRAAWLAEKRDAAAPTAASLSLSKN